jgi:hypothetical protein
MRAARPETELSHGDIGNPVKDFQEVSEKKEGESFWDKVVSKETTGR